MSAEYDRYLEEHQANVRKAFYWIKKSAPELLKPIPGVDYELNILLHDDTKTIPQEYEAYDNYKFKGDKSKEAERAYLYAKLQHRNSNEHHWEHWVLHDVDLGCIKLDMPYQHMIEMVCDWWSFSWKSGDLFAIFDWYEAHKKTIRISKKSVKELEEILDILKKHLIRVKGPRK